MAWFKRARKPIAAPEKTSRVPEGLWVKCPECNTIIYTKDLAKNLSVCHKCAYHFRLTAAERLRTLFDDEVWTEQDAGLESNDPLKFTDTKPYRARSRRARKPPVSATPSSSPSARSTASRPSSRPWSTRSSAAAWASSWAKASSGGSKRRSPAACR